MQRLPPFTVEDRPCRLPLTEAAAAALVGMLLDRTNLAAIDQLADALSLDPSLALWAACHQARGAVIADPPMSIARLAAWLAGRVSSLVRDAGRHEEGNSLPSIDRGQLAVLAARDVGTAERAVGNADACHDPRYLLALLRSAPAWLVAGGVHAEAAAALPGWLGRLFAAPLAVVIDSPVGDAAPWALALGDSLAGEPSPAPTAAIGPEGSEKGRAARARWLAPAGFASENFATLAGKLVQFADLEAHFQERLEEEKLEALAEFAAGAGHEINNPLAVIAGRAQLFLREEAEPRRRRELAVINTQARRIHEMIADLMLFARPPRPQPSDCDLALILREIVAELTAASAQRSAELLLVGLPETLVLQADATQIAVALRAVCENALAAVAQRGRIEIGFELQQPDMAVETARTSDPVSMAGVAISVRDNGPGMSALERRHAFDPFFSGRGAGRGLGLGLSKCWRIVTNHGGRVEIDSTPGEGTCVTILLPCDAPAAERTA